MEKIRALKQLPAWLLLNRALYLGEKSYLIRRQGRAREIQLAQTRRARLVILEKKFYFETQKSFPFSSIKDIKAAVAMDLPAYSPIKTTRFFIRKTGGTGDTTKVNLWFLDEKIVHALDRIRPLFIVPESAFLSFLPGASRIYTVRKGGNHTLFTCVGGDGSVKSMVSTGERADLKGFIRSIGAGAGDYPVTPISDIEEYLSLLQGILNRISIRKLPCFLSADALSFNFVRNHLTAGLGTAAALFVLYLILSGLLPYYTLNRLQEEDKALSVNISGLLKNEEAVRRYAKGQRELAGRINSYTYKTPIMYLLTDALPEGARISRLTIAGSVVEMKGITPKTSDLLSGLARGEGVRNARFTSPLRKDRKTGLEVFSLSFNYQLGPRPGDDEVRGQIK